MKEEKDKIYELEFGADGYTGKLKIQNSNNRVLAKVGDVLIDKLSWFRWNNAVKYLDKYNKLKKERHLDGIETPLPQKYLMDILNNAFMADENELQDLWVKLLVNWQDSSKKLDKRPIYINIIKSLTSTEAKILELVKNIISGKSKDESISSVFYKESFIKLLKISNEDYELSMINLFKNGCFESVKIKNIGITVGGIHPVEDMGMRAIHLTLLGFNLLHSLK